MLSSGKFTVFLYVDGACVRIQYYPIARGGAWNVTGF